MATSRVTARSCLLGLMLAFAAGPLSLVLVAEEMPLKSACRVSIALPRDTDMLYGVADLVAEVACPSGASAASVAFRVDGAPAGERTAPPWKVTWDAGGGFASHLVEARLTDRQGGRTSAFVLTPGAAVMETVLVTSTPIDLVELSVSVLDGEGRPVRDLGRDDFLVEEEGRRQNLVAARLEDRPLSVAVLIDASSSVKAFWPQLAAAAPALARALRPNDALKVVAFNGPAFMVQDFTRDPQRVQRSMDRFQAWGGGTSLYDTLAAVGTELAWGRAGRQAVVLITDGIDTLSRVDAPRLANYLRRTDVVVETFLVRPDAGGAAPPHGKFRKAMERVCRDTGGSLRPMRDLDGLTDEFRDLGEALQDRYYVSYHSDRAAREGWRSIRVEVRRPGVRVLSRRWVIGNRPVGGFLLAEMRSRDPQVRRKAAEWLGTMPAQGAGDALLGALSDRSLPVREAAAVALGRIREARAIDPLVELLDERDLGLRDAAAQGLRAFGPAAVPALLAALDRDVDRTRVELLDVLAEIGDARAVEAIERLAAPPHPMARTPTGDLPQSTPLRDRRAQDEMRVWALKALSRMGSDRVLPVLEKGVRDRNPDVAAAARQALVEHASPESFTMLHRFGQATEPDAALRAAARDGLTEGFYRLWRQSRLEEWLGQPVGAAIFVWVVDSAVSDPKGAGGWAGIVEAVGGGESAAGLLDAAAGHLPKDVAIRARSLAARLRAR